MQDMKESSTWTSPHLGQELRLVRWGHFGIPVLLFPTAGGDACECERFLMIRALEPLLSAGRIKVYSVDSIAGRAWVGNEPPAYCTRLQNAFDAALYHEVVPAIRTDCRTPDATVVAAGASIGAFNAVAALTRHPDAFHLAIGLSGTYDLSKWLRGESPDGFYFTSPVHFLPNLGESEQLRWLRQRFVLLATGHGRWEDPAATWHLARILGAKGIPNRVDPWGPEWDHDWPTWRAMLPKYLDELV
jgi:esterase/lipase superfamily enzyme